jgi:hypothetical protein
MDAPQVKTASQARRWLCWDTSKPGRPYGLRHRVNTETKDF